MARVSGKADSERLLARLGDAVRAARMDRGISQEALADAAAIDRSHLGKIERGERNISLLNLIRVAAALGIKASALLDRARL